MGIFSFQEAFFVKEIHRVAVVEEEWVRELLIQG